MQRREYITFVAQVENCFFKDFDWSIPQVKSYIMQLLHIKDGLEQIIWPIKKLFSLCIILKI